MEVPEKIMRAYISLAAEARYALRVGFYKSDWAFYFNALFPFHCFPCSYTDAEWENEQKSDVARHGSA